MKAQFYMDDLRLAVNAIKGFTGNDAAKPVHQYIKLSVNAATEQARAYATNGFIAAVETVPSNSDEDFDFMLRADALERLKGAETVELAVENGDMVVSSEFVTVRYHAPDPYEFFDIEKFGLAVYLLELEGFRIDALAFHLAGYYRALKRYNAEVMPVCCLYNHHVPGLDTLT